jgi:hypothetical protein
LQHKFFAGAKKDDQHCTDCTLVLFVLPNSFRHISVQAACMCLAPNLRNTSDILFGKKISLTLDFGCAQIYYSFAERLNTP